MVRQPNPPEALPPPEPALVAHGARVSDRIREEIRVHGGAIPFSRYMELALHAPGLGYYSAGLTKFGPAGDFVTAPEISPLFSRCLAAQVGQALAGLGGGDVLELGAGTGLMAAEMLAHMRACAILPERYLILETSAELRSRQRETLRTRAGHLADRVCWLEGLPAPGHRGVVIANEVVDALPACRFRVDDGGRIREFNVAWEDGAFAWRLSPDLQPGLADALQVVVNSVERPLPPGYVSELRLSAGPWIEALSRRIERGLILIVDYGYPRAEFYHSQRSGGTLVCHYRHRVHGDPLILTGLQDISVHVDFTGLAESAAAAGLEITGFTTQAEFLLAAGITELAADARPGSRDQLELTRQIKHLTLPGEMGELVKVLALGKGFARPLTGFARRDFRNRL